MLREYIGRRKKGLKIPNRQSEAIRRTNNTMIKWKKDKGTNNYLQNTTHYTQNKD